MATTDLFDDNLLADYADGFYGYGKYRGWHWFVGIEEGGGQTFREVADALDTWDQRGRRELEDLYECQDCAGKEKFFGARARLQPTWSRLIRILLSVDDPDVSTEAIRCYQRQQLGRTGRDTCLLELLPLPSSAMGKWFVGEWSRLPQLQTRDDYVAFYAPRRAERIRKRIAEYHPRAVVLYSTSQHFQQWWEIVAGGAKYTSHETDGLPYSLTSTGATVLAITRHPTSRGVTNEYWRSVGKEIGRRTHG
jgi:hypothetical protein